MFIAEKQQTFESKWLMVEKGFKWHASGTPYIPGGSENRSSRSELTTQQVQSWPMVQKTGFKIKKKEFA